MTGLLRALFVTACTAFIAACGTYRSPTYFTDGERGYLDPASVHITTRGGAEIRSLDGKPLIVGGDYTVASACVACSTADEVRSMRNRRMNHLSIQGLPGRRYTMEVGRYAARMNATGTQILYSEGARPLVFEPRAPGRYVVKLLVYKIPLIDREVFHAAVVEDINLPEEKQLILAATTEQIVGLTLVQALHALGARP